MKFQSQEEKHMIDVMNMFKVSKNGKETSLLSNISEMRFIVDFV